MIKYFCIHSKQKVYVCTIVPMPPVMGVRKNLSNISRTRKHIWLKVFSHKPMQKCRDVRKSQVSTTYKKKLSLIEIAKVAIVPMPPDKD